MSPYAQGVVRMILCAGESLIDFLPTEARDGSPAYRPANGGSIHNVALALGRLGVPVGFVGGISTDFFGEALARGLGENGVSLAHVSRLDRPTTLAFVSFQGSEARYAFYDAQAADRFWRLDDMLPIGRDVKALHFGCISLLRQPAADDFARLMEAEAGSRVIGFDANIRPNLVVEEDPYRERLDLFFSRAHIIKISDADLAWLAPGRDPALAAAEWLAAQARIVLLTRGGEGATLYARSGSIARPAIKINVADTVGAGDAFMAGFLASLEDRDRLEIDSLDRLTPAELSEHLDFALAVAAITCSRVGADPPRRDDIEAFGYPVY
jgi:fructokinase